MILIFAANTGLSRIIISKIEEEVEEVLFHADFRLKNPKK